jgi:hypothetical protein
MYGQHSSTSVGCDFYPYMDQMELKKVDLEFEVQVCKWVLKNFL